MSELKSVKLKDILSNPFREDSAFDKVKIETLRLSLERTGFWDGYLLAREQKRLQKPSNKYEAAFGHHRLEAARQLWGDDHKITVTVADLDDDLMLQMLANENSQDYQTFFYLAVMMPIEGVVRGYAEGRVELEEPENQRGQKPRYAPGFSSSSTTGKPYSAASIARYLGWAEKTSKGLQPATRVFVALQALELIEKGALKRSQFLTKTQAGAKALIDITKTDIRIRQSELDNDAQAHEDALRRAKEQGDEAKATKAAQRLADAEEKAERHAIKQASTVANEASKRLDSGEKTKDVVADYVAKVPDKPQPRESKKEERLSAAEKSALIDSLDNLWVEGKGKRSRVEASITGSVSDRKLAEALERLAKRYQETARLIKKGLG